MTERTQREGVLVEPYERLNSEKVKTIDRASMEILNDPGLLSYSEEVAQLFDRSGALVSRKGESVWQIRIPEKIVRQAIESAPSVVTLGARKPENRLVLDAEEPRARFGSGSEANIWLEIKFEPFIKKSSSEEKLFPVFERRQGTVKDLCEAAHLCELLENLDFFIRPVNIQDEDITNENKDVNKFFSSLNNTTKHVMAGLTTLSQLENVVKMGEIIAGGKDALRRNPVISFITCCVKSPLQFVKDTSDKLIAVARLGLPIVVSSSPMGGATAPFSEFGMVAQINAEILAGITLHQLVNPGAPVLYGSVPTRVRLDNLNDMYGAPEFNQYNLDCIQMARSYHLPCYSTAGIGDTIIPGIQATVEKLPSQFLMAMAGAQYIHYAFGLLERTNTFCPEQAILDDAHIGLVKFMVERPRMGKAEENKALEIIRSVMETKEKMYIYHLPLPTQEKVYISYPFHSEEWGGDLHHAHERKKELLKKEPVFLPRRIVEKIFQSVPGILKRLNPYSEVVKNG